MAHVNKFIDLHFHLDGAISPNIAKKLAKLQQIPLNFKSDEELIDKIRVKSDCQSLVDFLKCFEFPLTLLQSKIGISEAVRLVLEEAKENGVIYAEIRFAPQLHTLKGLTQEEVVVAAIEGLKKASVKANLILCLMRGNKNQKENIETVELAHKYLVQDGGVVALDLAGAESLFKTIDFKDLFELANKYKIPFTIHAGEADGFTSVNDAISFKSKRIGHGIKSVLSSDTINLAKNNNVYFEMCPTSNFQTKSINNIEEFPLPIFLKNNLNVTINTDDPAIEGTNIRKEFELLENVFNITKEQEIIFLFNSVECAFTSEKVKEKLRKQIFFNK